MKSIIYIILLYSFIVSKPLYPQDSSFFHYDWKTAIDTTWQDTVRDLSTDTKLAVFDSVWTLLDQKFAGFNNLSVNWDSLRTVYRPEIANGISMGRFTAILNYLSLDLKDGHTFIGHGIINQNPNPKPMTPALYPGGWGLDWHFGAGLSPLPDSSLLVYSVIPDHPLGLEPGDIILGYDGIPWKRIYPILIKMELPLCMFPSLGSNDYSINFNWLKAAGDNWHLFDTIDVVKYGSNDTLHLSTKVMENHQFNFLHSDQLPQPGIKFPQSVSDYKLSWGLLENTNIGYIYIWSWYYNNISSMFYNAVDSLVHVYHVKGLILDMRDNTGGYMNNTYSGLSLLFRTSPSILGLAERFSPFDHFTLKDFMNFSFASNPDKSFAGPVAVLVSTYTESAAEFVCYALKQRPYTKFFGNPTSGSFASLEQSVINGFSLSYAYANGFDENKPNNFLDHWSFPVDQEVYFKPEDVRHGVDSYVKAAVSWIDSITVLSVPSNQTQAYTYSLQQNYPNPFNPTTTIVFAVPKTSVVSLKVYNALGQFVTTLFNKQFNMGSHQYIWNASSYPSGVYFLRLEADGFSEVKKALLIK